MKPGTIGLQKTMFINYPTVDDRSESSLDRHSLVARAMVGAVEIGADVEFKQSRVSSKLLQYHGYSNVPLR